MKAKRISRLMIKVWEETKRQQYTLQLLKELGMNPPKNMGAPLYSR